mmetsp:Transcript_78962/g.124560  ORF Transcript_78962/g.124560 Transcript_78962/m.124560 type:complete len:219 (+) Transcript_78962:784-1440(+)
MEYEAMVWRRSSLGDKNVPALSSPCELLDTSDGNCSNSFASPHAITASSLDGFDPLFFNGEASGLLFTSVSFTRCRLFRTRVSLPGGFFSALSACDSLVSSLSTATSCSSSSFFSSCQTSLLSSADDEADLSIDSSTATAVLADSSTAAELSVDSSKTAVSRLVLKSCEYAAALVSSKTFPISSSSPYLLSKFWIIACGTPMSERIAFVLSKCSPYFV